MATAAFALSTVFFTSLPNLFSLLAIDKFLAKLNPFLVAEVISFVAKKLVAFDGISNVRELIILGRPLNIKLELSKPPLSILTFGSCQIVKLSLICSCHCSN